MAKRSRDFTAEASRRVDSTSTVWQSAWFLVVSLVAKLRARPRTPRNRKSTALLFLWNRCTTRSRGVFKRSKSLVGAPVQQAIGYTTDRQYFECTRATVIAEPVYVC